MAIFGSESFRCIVLFLGCFWQSVFITSTSPLLADFYRAFPEIGLSSDLGARLPQSSSGWVEVSGWTHTHLSDNGRFLFGAPLEMKSSRFEIPKSGIYFVSMSIHLSQADDGIFRAAFVINGQIKTRNRALAAARRGHQGGDFGLAVSGFADLRSSDRVSVFVFSETDEDWVVEDDSQFSVRYAGPIGSFPAFSAIKNEAANFGRNSTHAIRNWDTSGSSGLFTSLSGFSPSTGEFIPICDGIYFLAANIRVEAKPGSYALYFSVNGEMQSPLADESTFAEESLFTMNLHGAFYLKRGDTVSLTINASRTNARFTVQRYSGFSVSYIDSFNQSSSQGVSVVTQTTNEIPGTGWMEITTWPLPLNAHVQFYNPELFQSGRFECNEGGVYYVAVSLRVRGGNGNFALLVKSSGTSQLSGSAGLYTSRYNTRQSGYFSLSVSGLLELSKGQRVLVSVHSSFPDKWLIERGSGLSLMKTRYYWPAANSYIDIKLTLNESKWEEVTGWKHTEREGAFVFGTNFRASDARFTVTSSGVYFVSTNLLMRSAGGQISAVLAVDGQVNENNGLYATHAYSPANITLNIAGALDLEQGQNLSVFVRSERNGTWEVLNKSGFSVVFIGKSFAVPGFHVSKGSQSTFRTTIWVEIDNWQMPGSGQKGVFQNGDGLDNGRGIYVAPISGIYFASCTLVIADVDVDALGSYFEVYIGVNGQKALTNGLQNTRYIYGANPPSGSDVITMAVSGLVQLQRGDYAVIRARANMDFDWKVEGSSGFSVFLVSPSDIRYGNVGFLSRKSDTRIKSLAAGTWSKIGGWATQSDLTNGLFLSNEGSFSYEALSGDLSINHAGIYFISANIIVSNTPEFCELAVLAFASDGSVSEELKSGLVAVEQKPQSKDKYTLMFSGAVFLAKNRKIHVAVRSGSADPFTVWEGSGFSIARLIYPIEEPGFYAQVNGLRVIEQSSSWKKITEWETSGGSGLHIDGRGFNSFTGDFVVPLPGIYLASASIALQDASNPGAIRVRVSIDNDKSANNGLESSHVTDNANHVVVVASGSMKLTMNMVVSVIVRSENSSSFKITEGSYFTMRYISGSENTEGNMADRYSDNIYTSRGWKELVSWKTAGSGGQFQVGSIHQTTDRFSVSVSGIYFITANIQFLETTGLAIVGIVINSGNDSAVIAKRTCATNCSINLAASVKLKAHTFVSVHVYSDDTDRWIVSSKSSKSNLHLKPVLPAVVVQGFLGKVVSNISVVGREPSDWFRVGNWSTSGLPGCFQTIHGFSIDGVFVVYAAGVYTVTVNVILRCTGVTGSDFELLVAVNGRFSSNTSLYSRQSVSSFGIDTLNIMAVVHLYKWDTLAVFIRSESSFEVLQDSTFSVVINTVSGGPFLCSNNGPSLIRELSPASLRTRVGSSVTWSCEAVGETPPQYRWLKNYEKMSNESLNSLTIINGTVEDSGDYACVAEVYPISVSSNIASLTMYDPQPAFLLSNHVMSLDENGPVNQLVINITVRAESREKANANMFFRIISGNTNNSFFLLPNISTNHFGIYTTHSLDRESIPFYQLLVEAVNMDEHAQNTTTTVSIAVNDQNDNAPVFDQKNYDVTILENATVGHVVQVLKAPDADEGNNANVNFVVLAGSGMETFSLNRTSGEITLMRPIDHETQLTFSLFIAARDPDYTAFTEVTIAVLDVNEHKPSFDPLVYHVTISEAAVIGTSVLKLSASDEDTGTSAELFYSILTGDPHGMFAVNKDGVITVAKELDHESNTTHNITVTAHDQGVTQLYAEAPAYVYIRVRDLNDNSPIFEVSLYEETISESTPPGTSLLRVRATDLDKSRVNSELIYSSIAKSLIDDFLVDSTSGVIYVNKTLDFERTTVYRFQVVVRDSGVSSRMDVTSVVISISDENDNFPVFYPSRYNISISETTIVGTDFFRVYATDNDSTTNAALCYFITSGNENSTFIIDEVTGTLIVASGLDHEVVSRYILTISVTDRGAPPLEAQTPATVVVEVFDENDNPPLFDSEFYAVSVYEDIAPGFHVLTVHASDRDSDLNQEVTYDMASFSKATARTKFGVNSENGTIFTKERLDREEQQVYEFTVVARDGGKVPLEGFAKVIITLIDVNDNQPVFEPAHYQVTVSEHTPVQTTILFVRATDNDTSTNGRLTFSVTSGNLNNTFAVTEDGAVYTTKKLEYRTFTTYNLTITTADLGSPSLSASAPAIVRIIVDDINDNEPVFDKVTYSTFLYENVTVGESVLQVRATDGDSDKNREITYSIGLHHVLAREKFDVNITSGEIFVKSALDYEMNTVHSFTVSATDAGDKPKSGLTWVHISVYDVNDNRPEFVPASYHREVSEASSVGTMIVRVRASDNDTGSNSRLRFSIQTGNENNTFAVESDGTIILMKLIDYESRKMFNLTIRAEDDGDVPRVSKPDAEVTITVHDYNDNRPKFEPPFYFVKAFENTTVHTVLLTVTARDADSGSNSQLSYAIMDEKIRSIFAINPISGEIRIISQLDHETTKLHEFTVLVVDNGTEPLSDITRVIIEVLDTNDQPPEFVPNTYEVTVSEATLPGVSIVKLMSRDNDSSTNAQLVFNITSGNDDSVFKITENGLIILNEFLDHEETRQYNLTIEARDLGIPSFVSSPPAKVFVYVQDVNDNQPVFDLSLYSASIPENTSIGSLIMRVHAVDFDNRIDNQLTYTVNSSSVTKFEVDPISGDVTLRESIDYEEVNFYSFSIVAFDAGREPKSSSCRVEIFITDINDEKPVFLPEMYYANISETSVAGSVVAIVTARDNDSGSNALLTYSIIKGNFDAAFAIDEHGRLKLVKEIDFEISQEYNLTISAHDHGTIPLSTERFATVVINVLDVNDNNPVFNQSLYELHITENTSVYSSVLRVYATDRDSGENGLTRYEILDNDIKTNFKLDNTTGLITTRTILDFKQRQMFEFTVVAFDGGNVPRTGSSRVRIRILDINDNPPIFQPNTYHINITEGTLPGTVLLRVSATDNDSTVNAQLKYDIVSRDNETFLIDDTGVITLIRDIDFEVHKFYEISVVACDGGFPKLVSSPAFVHFNVFDLNDNTPQFNTSFYEAVVAENITVGTHILSVFASDLDSSSNGEVCYEIITQNTNLPFNISNATGSIHCSGHLDHDNLHEYSFTVVAQDRGNPPRMSKVNVRIFVTDINDNSPIFSFVVYVTSLSEDVAIGTTVTVVEATDADSTSNGKLTFAIVQGNTNKSFGLDPDIGVITTKKSLDFEILKTFNLTVSVSDNGDPMLSSAVFVTVRVIIVDKNDNPPKFNRSRYEDEVTENLTSRVYVSADASINSAVITMIAADPDSGLGGEISYAVLDIIGTTFSDHSETFSCVNDSYGTFRIDEHTGTLRTASILAARCLYNVTIRARDHGSPPLSSVVTIEIETGSRNFTAQGIPTNIAIVSKEDSTTVIVIICVFLLIIAIIIALWVWRESRRHMLHRTVMLAQGGYKHRDDDCSSSEEHEKTRFRKYPMDHRDIHNDYCSTTTEMPSSLQTPHSPRSSGVDTDLLETFTTPYGDKDGYTVLDGDTESFCVSIDFGMESDHVTFPSYAIEGKTSGKKNVSPERARFSPLLSSTGSKRSQASLPAKLGSRNRSQRTGVREVTVSDTHL